MLRYGEGRDEWSAGGLERELLEIKGGRLAQVGERLVERLSLRRGTGLRIEGNVATFFGAPQNGGQLVSTGCF